MTFVINITRDAPAQKPCSVQGGKSQKQAQLGNWADLLAEGLNKQAKPARTAKKPTRRSARYFISFHEDVSTIYELAPGKDKPCPKAAVLDAKLLTPRTTNSGKNKNRAE